MDNLLDRARIIFHFLCTTYKELINDISGDIRYFRG